MKTLLRLRLISRKRKGGIKRRKKRGKRKLIKEQSERSQRQQKNNIWNVQQRHSRVQRKQAVSYTPPSTPDSGASRSQPVRGISRQKSEGIQKRREATKMMREENMILKENLRKE